MSNFDDTRSGEILTSALLHREATGEIPLDVHAAGILAFKGHLAYSTSMTKAEFENIIPFFNQMMMTLRPDIFEGGENSPYKRMERAFIKDLIDIRAGRL